MWEMHVKVGELMARLARVEEAQERLVRRIPDLLEKLILSGVPLDELVTRLRECLTVDRLTAGADA